MTAPRPSRRDSAAAIDAIEREVATVGLDAEDEAEDLREFYGLGADLINLRRRRQLTQKQLATACGLAQSEISRIESGRSNPTVATLRTLARSLDAEIRIVEREQPIPTGTTKPRNRLLGRGVESNADLGRSKSSG